MAELDNRCGGPFNFNDVVFNNVTIKGCLTLTDTAWLCEALGPCINAAVAAINITAPPVDLTAGGVITGTLGNAHLNASVAASELQGQEFVNLTLSGGGTTLNGNLSFDAAAQSDVVALTQRATFVRGQPPFGTPINISDLMLRFDDLRDAIRRTDNLWLGAPAIQSGGLMGTVDDPTSVTGHITFDVTAQEDVVALTSRYAGHGRGGVLNPGVPINVSDLMLRYDELANAINSQSGLWLHESVLSGNLTIIDDGAQQSITGLFNDCNGTPHVPNATIPTCAQMNAAIANITIPAGSSRYLKRSVLTANTTYTASSKMVSVELIAGGGGSGAATLLTGEEPTNGLPGGGGGGGYVKALIVVQPGTELVCTVGTGGEAGVATATNTDGGKGGDSSITIGGAHVVSIDGGGGGHSPRIGWSTGVPWFTAFGGAGGGSDNDTAWQPIFRVNGGTEGTSYTYPFNSVTFNEPYRVIQAYAIMGDRGGPGAYPPVTNKDAALSGWGGRSHLSNHVESGYSFGGQARYGGIGGWGSGAAAPVGGHVDAIGYRVQSPNGQTGANGVVIIEEWVTV